jgi:hypothetical protein
MASKRSPKGRHDFPALEWHANPARNSGVTTETKDAHHRLRPVSTYEQCLDLKLDALRKAGCASTGSAAV